ncbi:MAG TPA: BadF/BadG/BcrA/BcrD ATPase family protein, partial [Polyangiaceae bacterium]|nr:BadF/BadG/BcrA/BcrD ATPase family protein [Polyangiaceae bacterium]
MGGAAIGLDAGSTTVKVVASDGDAIVHREYRRHHGRCADVAAEMLRRAETAVGPGAGRYATGSAASAFADRLGATYVHEVHAVAAAVAATLPAARTVIELGGQDAKMIHLDGDGGFASEMNERCAAGTGATLDRCLYRLGLGEQALGAFTWTDETPPAVSAKCGVFAETDIVNLVKAGVPVRRAMAALLDAIVRGGLAVLARGRPLAPPVVLLGGPHAFVPALANAWERHLRDRWAARALQAPDDGAVIVPPDAAYFAALGALQAARDVERVAAARGRRSPSGRRLSLARAASGARKVRTGLADAGFDAEEMLRRHAVPTRHPTAAANSFSLGID